MTASHMDFWFDLCSPYSYLSAQRIEALAARSGVRVRWRPFLLGPIFKSMGWQEPPFNAQPLKRDYMWRDLARQARKYGVEFNTPSVFPRRALTATRVAVVGGESPWVPEFCRRSMAMNFADDLEIDSASAIEKALDGLVEDGKSIVSVAGHESAKQLTRQRTEEAMALKIFGAPTFMVGDEMFWGNDRLEDALCHAAQQHPGFPPGETSQAGTA